MSEGYSEREENMRVVPPANGRRMGRQFQEGSDHQVSGESRFDPWPLGSPHVFQPKNGGFSEGVAGEQG
jgi:hypothetical protein